jgi:hypothetical protein
MVIGRRHIALVVLIFALLAALYLNWKFSKKGVNLAITNQIDSMENYGETRFVSSNKKLKSKKKEKEKERERENKNKNKDDDRGSKYGVPNEQTRQYFAQAKINSQKANDSVAAHLNQAISNEHLTNQQKSDLLSQLSTHISNIKKEADAENLIKSKMDSDCIVSVNKNNVNVIIDSKGGLLQQQAAQIKDIIFRIFDMDSNLDVVITEYKGQ